MRTGLNGWTNPKPDRLTVVAGWILAVASVLHMIVFTNNGAEHVAGWFGTDLWSKDLLWDDASMAHSVASYWASLASFAVPLLLLGLLIVGRGRRGQTMPVWFDLALGAWFLLNSIVLQPSGFPLGLLAVILLLVTAKRSSP